MEPKKKNSSRRFRSHAVGQPSTRGLKSTILIAEDDEDGRSMLNTLLSLKGYDVVEAANGLQAVEVALTNFPQLILLDLELPLLNGFAVTRNLRRHPKFKQVPVVVVSGHDPATHREAALNAGCTEYLVKPIDFEQLDQILVRSVPLSNVAPRTRAKTA